jgi:xylulokinase
MLLLGIDIGTSGARAIAVDSVRGDIVASATSEYPLSTPKPLWAEQDPEHWWKGTCHAVREVVRQLNGKKIDAVGLSGQMHGVVLLGKDGEVLGPSLIWCDGRSQVECEEITTRIGAERLITLTSNPALVGFSAPKLLWLRKHEPARFDKARTFLLPKDFIRFRLTNERFTEVSDASGTLLFDVAQRAWSKPVLSALGLDASLLPDVAESHVVTARVHAAAADLLGIPSGTPVVGGGGDQAAGAVGTGIVRTGIVSSTIGSSGVVFAHADEPVRDPKGRVHTFCHAVPGAWHVMGVTQGAGLSLRWARDLLFGPETPYEHLMEQARRAPAGSEGLLFLPYLMGERTPHLNPQARGTWFGLTAAHGKQHLIRSVLEGVTYSLEDCLTVLEEMGLAPSEIRASGGGARSALWRQIQADVFEKNVVTVSASEGPAFGAALLAGVGTGAWSSVAEACEACIRVTSHQPPGIETERATYRRGLALYRELYTRTSELFPRLA